MLPIAQASVLRWVLMGGISTNLFFGMVFCAVSWCEYGNVRLPLWGVWCCWESVPGCGVWGLCLAHCWGSEATGPCAAMHGTVVSVFPASGSVLARVCGGGLVDGVVV